jgi:hypothetical protein
MMKKKARFLAVPVLLTLAGMFGDRASADSIGGAAAQGENGEDEMCLVRDLGEGSVKVHPDCPNANVMIPLTVNASGGKFVSFTSRATSTGSQCRMLACDQFGTNDCDPTSWVQIPVSSNLILRQTPSKTLPSSGTLFLRCFLEAGAEVMAVNWPD